MPHKQAGEKSIQLIILDDDSSSVGKRHKNLKEGTPEHTAAWEEEIDCLKMWTFNAMVVHGSNFVISAGLAWGSTTFKEVIIPLRTSFTEWDTTTEIPYQNLSSWYGVPLCGSAALLSLSAALYHLRNYMSWEVHSDCLWKQKNDLRWREYSMAMPFMVMLIAMIFGLQDTISLIMMCCVTLGQFWLYDIFETMNVGKAVSDVIWVAQDYALIAMSYFPIVQSIFVWKSNGCFTTVPTFVWGLVCVWITQIFMVVTIMNGQYKQLGSFVDTDCPSLRYAMGERQFLMMNLICRSLFVWCIIVGCSVQDVY